MQDAAAYCEQLVREGDKDRFLATLFAPADKRAALFALYAFNLEVSRVHEAVSGPMPGEIRLQWWREVLSGAREEEAAANPVAGALRDVMRRNELPVGVLAGLIEARSFDLYDDPMQNWPALEGYCERTASAMFALAGQILDPGGAAQMRETAREGGIAYGIAQALAAFPRDAARGRLYLPIESMDANGANVPDIFAGRATAQVRAALAEARARARGHLTIARTAALTLPAAAAPAFLPLALTRHLLDRLEESDPFAPVAFPQWRRQWILWRAARRSLARQI